MPQSSRFAAVLVLAAFAAPLYPGVTPYPAPPGDAPNAHLSVTVNGTPVDCVTTAMKVGYAHFAIDEPARIVVTADEPIKTFDLSPHRLNLEAVVSRNTLTFTIDQPRKLHLRVNDLPRFFILADPPEVNAPMPGDTGVFVLTDMGVDSSPDKIQTAALQHAIDTATSGGGTLYVPPGIYVAGTLSLTSNASLYLAPGAIIKGTGKVEDYPKPPVGGASQIAIVNADNVHIFGRGVIDNNGLALREPYRPDRKPGRTKMVVANGATNLVIEDIFLRDAAVWCVHPFQSNNLRFSNIKLISMTRHESSPDDGYNTDAFDPDNSSNVLIENNFISVDDDPIAVKLTYGEDRDMSNITFRDNVIFTMCSALKLGTEITNGKTVSNVLFENNDVVHCDIGISVYCYKGGNVDNARWINNYIEQTSVLPDNSPHHHHCNIFFTASGTEGTGHISNLLVKDNTFENFGPEPSRVRAGNDADHTVDNVRIENLVIAGERRSTIEEARIDVTPTVTNFSIE